MTGQRVASATFLELMRPYADVEHVDVGSRSPRPVAGEFDAGYIRRSVQGLRRVREAIGRAPEATVYFCPSTSGWGLGRDLATVAALRGVRRIVAHVHAGDHERQFRGWRAPLARWIARRVDAYCVPTETQARALRPVVAPTPVWAVTNVVDPALRFDQAELDAVFAERRRSPGLEVLYLSNLIPSKGYADVLRALALAPEDVRATFAGSWADPQDRVAFMEERERLGLTRRARVLDSVYDRAEARALLRAADVVCLPTTYPHEAQPLAVLEGMAAGCPVVSTAHASLPEYVLDGETGLVVPPSDPAAIARALTALTDGDARERMGRRAHAVATERFAPECAIDPLLQSLGIR